MNKQGAKYLMMSSFAIAMALVTLWIIFHENIKADADLGYLKGSQTFQIVLDGENITYNVKTYSKNGVDKKYLFSDHLLKTKILELPGFEEEISLCPKPVLKGGGGDAVCFCGSVGVHSQNVVFVYKNFSLVEIKNDQNQSNNIITDVPSFQIADYTGDGMDDLVVDSRDYDSNPLSNVIKEYYRNSKDGLIFDKKESAHVK